MVETKRLTRNLFWLYAGDVGAKALGLVAFGALNRALGKERYGDLEFALGVLFVLYLVQESGLDPYGAREAAKEPGRARSLAGTILVIRVALVALGLAVLVLLWLLAGGTPEGRLLLLLYGLVLLAAPFELRWAFQAGDRMSVVAASTFVRQAVLATAALLLVGGPRQAWIVPVADGAGLGLVAATHQLLFRRLFGPIEFRGAVRRAREVAREAAPIAASSVAWAVRLFFPGIALRMYVDSAAVGEYAAGHRLVVSMHAFVWLYFFNLLPTLARATLEDGRETYRRVLGTSFRVVSWAVLPGCLLLAALAPWLMRAYAPEIPEALPPFRVQIFMLAAAFLSGHMRYSLIAWGRQGAEFRANLAGAVVSVGACLVLGARLTPLAAAWIFTAAEAVTLLVADRMLAHHVEPLGLPRRVARPLAVAACGAAALVALEGRPLAGAAAVAALTAVGVLLLERQLLGDARGLLRAVLGRAGPAGRGPVRPDRGPDG